MDENAYALNQTRLRAELRPFLAKNDALGFALVAVDLAGIVGLAILAVVVDPIWIRLPLSIGSGAMIAALFVLGHDAIHGSLTSNRTANAILGRIAFLPALHNATLWFIQHNRIHHQAPNVQGLNSWSPLSPGEYAGLKPASRLLYRFYRSAPGIAPYYLVERWLKHKLVPRRDTDPELAAQARWDFLLVCVALAGWLAIVVSAGAYFGDGNPASAIVFGFAVPFLVWNLLMGQTVLLQHTHPRVRWYRSEQDARADGGQESRTIHVATPRWYGLMGHDIMAHPAHHVNPMIPCYRLHAAQARLDEVLGPRAIVEAMGPRPLFEILRGCKLYDYDGHAWVDFSGRRTTPVAAAAA
jgi:acyl-lipid omega-6 desaturase (Delta-12 desaturase)